MSDTWTVELIRETLDGATVLVQSFTRQSEDSIHLWQEKIATGQGIIAGRDTYAPGYFHRMRIIREA